MASRLPAAQATFPEKISQAASPETSLLDAAIARSGPAPSRAFALAPRLELVTLTVLAATSDARGPSFVVGHASERAPARRAAGCLVAPEAGDSVVCACAEDGAVAILSVLARAGADVATLSVEGAAGLRMTAPELALVVDTLDVAAATVRGRVGALSLVGKTASLALHTIETVASRLQASVHEWVLKAGTALRVVDQVDSTVAETVLIQAHQTFAVQSANALISSDQDIRIDGERISMG